MTGHGNGTSCRNVFKQLNMLPLKSQYIFSVLLFFLKNRNLFASNSNSQNRQTRLSDDLHLLSSSLSICQNGAYFAGIRTFNKLPLELKELVEFPTKCEGTLRRYLVSHCLYSLDELIACICCCLFYFCIHVF
jgi:hypothetical protein